MNCLVPLCRVTWHFPINYSLSLFLNIFNALDSFEKVSLITGCEKTGDIK